jgi:hypothetical protein
VKIEGGKVDFFLFFNKKKKRQGPCGALSPNAKQPLSLHVFLLSSLFTFTILFIFFSNKKRKKIGLPFLVRRKKTR